MMAQSRDPVAETIVACLRPQFPADTIIDVTPSGVRNNLHVLVVSHTLDHLTEQQKQERIWALLDEAVKAGKITAADLSRISLVLPFSVEELRR